MELSSNTIQFLSMGIGMFMIFFGDVFPESIATWIKIAGIAVIFAPLAQENIMPWYTAKNTCYRCIVENNGAEFYIYEDGTSKEETDTKSNPPVHTRTLTSRWPCEMMGCNEEYTEYYGKFETVQLQSDKGPIGPRLRTSQRWVELLGAVFQHRAVVTLVVEDVITSGTEEYMGERKPTFKIKRVIQGDYERNIPEGKAELIIVKNNPQLTERIRKIIAQRDKLLTIVSQYRVRYGGANASRLQTELRLDSAKATESGLVKDQTNARIEGRIYASHINRQERDWEKTSKRLSDGTKLPKWLIPSIIGLVAVIVIFYMLTTNKQLIAALQETQNQVVLLIALGILAVITYFIVKRRNQ